MDKDTICVSLFTECGGGVGDLIFVIDVSPKEKVQNSVVTEHFRQKMKFIADIVTSLKYGMTAVRIAVCFLSYTQVRVFDFVLFMSRLKDIQIKLLRLPSL